MKNRNIFIRVNTILKQLLIDEICFIQICDGITEIHIPDKKSILCDISLSELEKRLNGYSFFRINRQTLLNTTHIDQIVLNHNAVIKTKCNNEFRVSRRKINLLLETVHYLK